MSRLKCSLLAKAIAALTFLMSINPYAFLSPGMDYIDIRSSVSGNENLPNCLSCISIEIALLVKFLKSKLLLSDSNYCFNLATWNIKNLLLIWPPKIYYLPRIYSGPPAMMCQPRGPCTQDSRICVTPNTIYGICGASIFTVEESIKLSFSAAR
jgi:hypothetical protein